MIVLLDNGHGIDTPGKRSPEWDNGLQLMEWEFTRDVVKRIDNGLTERKIKSHIMVPEKKDIRIRERISRSYQISMKNKIQTVCLSIHSNAAPRENPIPSGIETLYYSMAGYELGKIIQDYLVAYTGWKDRGMRKTYEKRLIDGVEKVIYKVAITRYTPMPCVLTENGFYTNFDQCQELMKDDVRENIAQAHIEAITKYIQNLKYDGRLR